MADNLSFALSKSKMFAFKMSLRTAGTLLKKNNFLFGFMDFSLKFVWPKKSMKKTESKQKNYQVISHFYIL